MELSRVLLTNSIYSLAGIAEFDLHDFSLMPLAFSLPPHPLSPLTSTGQTTVNPPLSPPRDLFNQAHLRAGGGLNTDGGLI